MGLHPSERIATMHRRNGDGWPTWLISCNCSVIVASSLRRWRSAPPSSEGGAFVACISNGVQVLVPSSESSPKPSDECYVEGSASRRSSAVCIWQRLIYKSMLLRMGAIDLKYSKNRVERIR